MITPDKEARDRAHMRDLRSGCRRGARRSSFSIAVLQKKQPLDDILGRSLDKGAMFNLPTRDRALTRAIVATSLRRKGQIDHVLGTFLERGMPEKSGTLYPILLSAAAQLIFLKTPPHAAIDLAVTLAQYDPRAKRYDKLVNAVLRRVASRRRGDRVRASMRRGSTRRTGCGRAGSTYWGEPRARASPPRISIEPPLDLTVKSEPELWAERLRAACCRRAACGSCPRAASRRFPASTRAPGGCRTSPPLCRHGWSATSRASAWPISARRPAARPRSSCSPAPRWSAVDISKTRLGMVRENLDRLGLAAELVLGDAATCSPDDTFDAVLLDAPCSSTGTIRRHPDIPYTKSPKDIEALAGLQARLLDNAAKLTWDDVVFRRMYAVDVPAFLKVMNDPRSVSFFDGSVSGVSEVVVAFGWIDGVDEASDVAPGIGDGSLLSGSHPMFDLGEGLLDRIEVGE